MKIARTRGTTMHQVDELIPPSSFSVKLHRTLHQSLEDNHERPLKRLCVSGRPISHLPPGGTQTKQETGRF